MDPHRFFLYSAASSGLWTGRNSLEGQGHLPSSPGDRVNDFGGEVSEGEESSLGCKK